MVVRPLLSILKTVVVAKAAVELLTMKSGAVPPESPATDNLAPGVVVPMPMWLAMVFLLGVLWVLSLTAGLPIGNIAHLGGLLVGVGYGIYLKKKYPRKTKMISRYFSR